MGTPIFPPIWLLQAKSLEWPDIALDQTPPSSPCLDNVKCVHTLKCWMTNITVLSLTHVKGAKLKYWINGANWAAGKPVCQWDHLWYGDPEKAVDPSVRTGWSVEGGTRLFSAVWEARWVQLQPMLGSLNLQLKACFTALLLLYQRTPGFPTLQA